VVLVPLEAALERNCAGFTLSLPRLLWERVGVREYLHGAFLLFIGSFKSEESGRSLFAISPDPKKTGSYNPVFPSPHLGRGEGEGQVLAAPPSPLSSPSVGGRGSRIDAGTAASATEIIFGSGLESMAALAGLSVAEPSLALVDGGGSRSG
jgi:hypothetical protein